MQRPCRLVLVGMMGSGKSTVGRLVAERTGWPLIDNDELLWTRRGATPRTILERSGDAALLAAEVDTLLAALATAEPCIVTAAGRAIDDPGARAAMVRDGVAAWLQVSPGTVLRRAVMGTHRPWPSADRESWIRETMARREPLYASVADLRLEADSRPPSVLADAIVAHLRGQPACRERFTTA